MLSLPALPLLASALALLSTPARARATNAALALLTAAVACVLAGRTLLGDAPPAAVADTLRGDGLASLVALVVAVTSAIGAVCATCSFTVDQPVPSRTYTVLAPLLSAALLVAALADHLGVLWIALELAAVVAAFLVGAGGGRAGQQAAFKYMLLGSAGLVFALLATAVAHSAAVPVLGHGEAALSFSRVREVGAGLAPATMRIALALAAVGYGLKAGLFPLHVWKPDAYAEAPAPVTALLAGGAVLVPLEALIRFGALAAAAGESAFVRQLFVTAGALSMIAALMLMVREHDLRRVLAFTSVEHVGLVLLAVGIGGDAARGGLVHLVGNGVLKALAFGLLGFVAAERGGADSQKGRGLYHRSFTLAAVFVIVIAAGLGFPPFSLFTSELWILRALFAGGHLALAFVVLLALAAIFGFVTAVTLRLVFARSDQEAPPASSLADAPAFFATSPSTAERLQARHRRVALALGIPTLVALAWLGMALPRRLWDSLARLAAGIAP